jgi:hypothetical protein
MPKHIKYLQTRIRQLLRFALAVSSVCVCVHFVSGLCVSSRSLSRLHRSFSTCCFLIAVLAHCFSRPMWLETTHWCARARCWAQGGTIGPDTATGN